LVPALGARGAAALQSAFISDTVRKARELSSQADCFLFLTDRSYLLPLPPEFHRLLQQGRDLGARLSRAFERLLANHRFAVIIGTDSPELSPLLLLRAMHELESSDAVLGPCPDGGFYLIGLRRAPRARRKGLFHSVRWGTSRAFRDMARNLSESGLITAVLEPLPDVDRPADFMLLRKKLKRHLALRRLAPATWRLISGKQKAESRKPFLRLLIPLSVR